MHKIQKTKIKVNNPDKNGENLEEEIHGNTKHKQIKMIDQKNKIDQTKLLMCFKSICA